MGIDLCLQGFHFCILEFDLALIDLRDQSVHLVHHPAERTYQNSDFVIGNTAHRNFSESKLDLIYILDRQRYNENWNKVMEVEEPIAFVSSASSPLAGRKGMEAEELLEHPFFLTEKDENYRRELDSFLETKGRMLTPALEISNTEFIIRMVRENRGISYLPLFAVREWVEQGELAILDVPELKRTLYRQIFYHRNKWLSPEMEEFIRTAEYDIV